MMPGQPLRPATAAIRTHQRTSMPAAAGLSAVPLLRPPSPTFSTPVSAARRTAYCVTPVDDRGRLGDASAVRALGWRAGCGVGFSILGVGAAAKVERGGDQHVDARGRLCLPLPVRRSLRLGPGDRVLLAAEEDRKLIIVYTTGALAAMTAWYLGSIAEALP